MKPSMKKWKAKQFNNWSNDHAVERAIALRVHINSLACAAPPPVVPGECPSSWNDQLPPGGVAIHHGTSQIHQQIIPNES